MIYGMIWYTEMILYGGAIVLCTCIDCLVDSYAYLDSPIGSSTHVMCLKHGLSIHVYNLNATEI